MKFVSLWRWAWSTPWLILCLMAMVFGANGTAARLAVDEISPLVLVCGRWTFVALFLGVIFKRDDWLELRDLLRTHWFLVGWIGLLGFSGFNAIFYIAARHTTAVNLTLLQCAIPPLVLAGAAIVFRTKIRLVQILGMTLTFLGVLIVASKGDVSRLSAFRFDTGDLMVLVACLFYAAYALALRVRPPVSPMVFFAGTAFASFVCSLPMAGVEIALGHAFWPSIKGLVLTFFVAVGPSLTGQLCFLRGVDLIGPGRAGLFANLIPIFGALTAVVVLHETFTSAHAIAVVLGLGGVSLAEWQGATRRSVADPEPAGDARLPQADQGRDR